MTKIYNNLDEELFKSDLPLACKLIAERICALTKGGEKECFISNSYLMNLYNMGERTVQRAINLLIQKQIIRSRVTRKGDKKVRLVSFIYKTLESRLDDFQNGQNDSIKTVKMTPQNGQNDSIKTVKKAVFSIHKNDLISKDLREDQKSPLSESSNLSSNTYSLENIRATCRDCFSEMMTDYPELKNMNSDIIADGYFAYREEYGWKGVKQLRLNLKKWILRDLESAERKTTQNKTGQTKQQSAGVSSFLLGEMSADTNDHTADDNCIEVDAFVQEVVNK
ncbi:MAG: helix-turn-helix domain-containing protein [Succinivibrio sp.]|nr:helix-turn-helix domain-containing protein [Succinivibrio sp.]